MFAQALNEEQALLLEMAQNQARYCQALLYDPEADDRQLGRAFRVLVDLVLAITQAQEGAASPRSR